MFEATFLQMYFFIEYCYLPCNIVVSLFVLLAALNYLKPKVHNVATISPVCIIFWYLFSLIDSQLAVKAFLDIT